MFDKPPHEVIGYKVDLGGGRFPESVIGRLIYGRKPQWLSGRGFVSPTFHGRAATVSLFGRSTATVCTVCRDSLNLRGVIVYPADDMARIVAEWLAGKLGKVRVYTAGEWVDDFAIDYAEENGEPIPERRHPQAD